MRGILASAIFAAAMVAGCTESSQVVSTVPATSSDIATAKNAVSACSSAIPSFEATQSAFLTRGFQQLETKYAESFQGQKAAFFGVQESGVVAVVFTKGRETGCIVQVASMTPEQALGLAQPWVKKYDGKTNAELGKGLSKKAAQAWEGRAGNDIVFIAARKNWRILEDNGAAVRMIQIQR
ncbi:MAG: hypothetical protein ACPGNV_00760 [Mangrovicoccus sp.]